MHFQYIVFKTDFYAAEITARNEEEAETALQERISAGELDDLKIDRLDWLCVKKS